MDFYNWDHLRQGYVTEYCNAYIIEVKNPIKIKTMFKILKFSKITKKLTQSTILLNRR